MFRLPGGPGSEDLPVASPDVDTYVTRVVFALAHAPEFLTVPADEIGALFAPSLGILRDDSIGRSETGARMFPEEIARKWIAAVAKVAGERADHDALIASLDASVQAAKAEALPLILQIANGYLVREERTGRYRGPEVPAALRGLCRELWGTARPLDLPTKNGTRPMTAPEICEAYGRTITHLATDYTATSPRLDWPNLTLCRGPARTHDAPEPKHDPEVAAWLALLGGESLAQLQAWIVWCEPARCRRIAGL